MLTSTRPDHGAEHGGDYAAYMRVSTDSQDVATQEHGIKAFLNGGDHKLKWFKEEGVSSGTDWHQRHELHACLDYCRKTNATLVIYSVSRMSRRTWETLRFLEQEVATGKIKLVVVDNPNLDHNTIGLLSAVAEMERTQIKARTKMALNRIKSEIAEKGSYVAKSGRTITKLGVHAKLQEAGKAGNEVNRVAGIERANGVYPIIENLRAQGLSYKQCAVQLDKMGVPTPRRQQNPDLAKKTEWHHTSVRNYYLRGKGEK
tara:strand:- start:2187 stop:2963 length:777 start_codon:yes stop_codon:yes gene_type:complete